MRILLVEDSEALLSAVAEQLENLDHQVIPCSRFEDAKRYLREERPDALITDVRLGPYNGLQLVLLARERFPEMMVVVYSAHDDPTIRAEAKRLGAVFLEKPVSARPLHQVLSGEVAGANDVA
jgi:DNA-binding response OmpR family regulator